MCIGTSRQAICQTSWVIESIFQHTLMVRLVVVVVIVIVVTFVVVVVVVVDV